MYDKVSIVIPVYNEIKTIETLVSRVEAVDLAMQKEIVLVDDASTDGTRELLEDTFIQSCYIIESSSAMGSGRSSAFSNTICWEKHRLMDQLHRALTGS